MLLCFLLLVSSLCYCASEQTDPGGGPWLVLDVCHLQVSNTETEGCPTPRPRLVYKQPWWFVSCTVQPLFHTSPALLCGAVVYLWLGLHLWLCLSESYETKEMTWNSILWPLCERYACDEAVLTWLFLSYLLRKLTISFVSKEIVSSFFPPSSSWCSVKLLLQKRRCKIHTATNMKLTKLYPIQYLSNNHYIQDPMEKYKPTAARCTQYHVSGHTPQTGFTTLVYSPTLNGGNVSHSWHKANRVHINVAASEQRVVNSTINNQLHKESAQAAADNRATT